MHVLHVETGQHFYGGAKQVALLLTGLHALGVANSLVCTHANPLAKISLSSVSRCHRLSIVGDLDPLFFTRLLSIIRTESPDLIHLHSRRGADTLGALAARCAGVKTLLSRRVDHPEPAWLVGPKYRLYNHVIAISDAIYRLLIAQGVSAGKITCVPSAVDVERYAQLPDAAYFQQRLGLSPQVGPLIGMAAQFIPRKGHRTLLMALPAVLREYPTARTVLFGQGPLRDDLRALAQTLGIAQQVTFAGFVDDLERLLPNLKVLVHPALKEGLGVTLLQAAAAQVPIIATPVGGIPEIVQHGVTGLLIAPNDPSALAAALCNVLADPVRAQAMGTAGRAWVAEHFSVTAMVTGNLRVYQHVLGIPQHR